MPVMSEQVRKARAEKLLQLRFEEGMSPSAAWLEVKRDSKAKAANPAELCRREIKWYREEYCVVDAPGEDDEPEDGEADGPNGAPLNGAPAEVTGDVAAEPAKATKPVKRCTGVEDRPCGKKISGRSPRCDDCRVLQKSVDNRNYYAANKWSLWAKRLKARVEAQFEAERVAAEKRVAAEAGRMREVQRKRQAREAQEEADRAAASKAEKERRAIVSEIVTEIVNHTKERNAKLPRVRMLEDGRSLTEYPDGRREIHDLVSGRSKFLKPREPIPPPAPWRWQREVQLNPYGWIT